ncbi:MAG: hypothetical protein KDD61_04235 [Bdellovibrionales bacterium]|nr:hypothetical protein [Bdellovibrionales bacterium]
MVRTKFLLIGFFSIFLLIQTPKALAYDFKENTPVPINGFRNPYNLTENQLKKSIYQGRLYALNYPVTVTGLLIPLKPVESFFKSPEEELDPLKRFLKKMGGSYLKMNSIDDLMNWLGLHSYPEKYIDDPIYGVPYKGDSPPKYRMGFTVVEKHGAKAFTISCAVCHSHNLFGKKIIGLTNRFPRANNFFVMGKNALSIAPTSIFKWLTSASPSETKIYQDTKENIQSVGAKAPIQLGLDTSLAHVSLSLARRRDDPYATKDYWSYTEPYEEPLAWKPSESKPGVWWNVKYKNKWLLDGSVVSGNPILTNILWNEIGRGSDLRELENWMDNNVEIIRDLTNAVYHNEAPSFSDFFPAENHFKWNSLLNGQKIFNNLCSKCHGKYEKNWDLPQSDQLSFLERIKTNKVIMPEITKVIDVGTDPHRYRAMNSLVQLNQLAISRNNGIQIQTQKGYVPPPLVGIWARWPYLHNNSIPNLCVLLTPSKKRPKTYWAGDAIDTARDFDSTCNGYPLGSKTPREWKLHKEKFFDSRRSGMRNYGHDERIFIKNGKNLLSNQDRIDLIQFLQTL